MNSAQQLPEDITNKQPPENEHKFEDTGERKRKYNFVSRVDNNIMLELVDKSMDNNNEFLPCVEFNADIEHEFDNSLSYQNAVIVQQYESNNLVKQAVNTNMNYFLPCSEHEHIKNPINEFLKFTQGRRNLYFQNDYRGIYKYKYSEMYADEMFKLNCCQYLFTPTMGKIFVPYERNIDKSPIIDLNIYNDVRAYDYLKSFEDGYYVDNCHKTNFKVSKNGIQKKYNIVTIPKDIMKLFAKITGNYEEALKYLTLDEKTGYYCYIHEVGDKIPVICKHQILLLKGINPIDVANECYRNGVCKYCGQDMIAYNTVETMTLPPAASSLIISFAECFKEAFSAETVIHIVSNYIIRRLEKLGISVYSTDECIGFTDVFILKIINLCRGKFKLIDYKIKILINKIASSLAFLGKSEADVKQILENNEVFGDVDSVITLLTSELSKEGSKDENNTIIPENVLFNSPTDRTPKNELQKLYMSDKWKMYEILILLNNEYNKLYNYKYPKEKLTDKVNTALRIIKMKINNVGYKFFQQMFKYYCPVHSIHHFKNGICEHCKLSKDGKNAEDIYKKFSNVINNSATEEPRTLELSKTKNEEERIKANMVLINAYDTNKLKEALHKFNIEYSEIAAIENRLKQFNPEFMRELSIILNVNYEKFIEAVDRSKLDEFIKKTFKFIIDRNIVKEETMVNIIYSHYSAPESSVLFYIL